MKLTLLFFLFSTQFSFSQELSAKLVEKIPLQAEKYFGTDDYGNHYYLEGNIFYKLSAGKLYQFSDLELGKPTSADIINPLKITLFYKRTNNVVFLDRRLIEIGRVRFNSLPIFRNLKHATTASNNSLWVFNLDSRQLEVFDYNQKTTIAKTQPVGPKVLDQKSNFNFCWLLTENTLEKYNFYGSILKKIPNEAFTRISENNGRILAQKGNELYFLGKGPGIFKKLISPEFDIKAFHLNDENLYLYDGKMLYKYSLLPKPKEPN